MNILFLGLMFNEEKYESIKKETLVTIDLPIAANVFQKNLIMGLEENAVECVMGLNSLPIGTWPKQYKKMYLGSSVEVINGISCFNTSTVNIVGIKQVSRTISAYRYIKKYIMENQNPVILTYNFYLPYYIALERLKKEGYKFHVCTVITDLPNEYGIETEKGIRKILARIMGKKGMDLTLISDSFVLLTEQMKNPLKVGERPYVVVEGFASNIHEEKLNCLENSRKNIVYTGTMNRKFGVENLIKAFLLLEDLDVELHLYGIGDMVEEIVSLAKQHSKIKYFGSVKREEALVAQRTATVLINPRGNNESYTKYSFPSKTMEYLISGRPVVAYLLDGIPKEYGEYLSVIAGSTVEDMAETLRGVLQLDENHLKAMGLKAQEFALREKNAKYQSKKILDMLSSCI